MHPQEGVDGRNLVIAIALAAAPAAARRDRARRHRPRSSLAAPWRVASSAGADGPATGRGGLDRRDAVVAVAIFAGVLVMGLRGLRRRRRA